MEVAMRAILLTLTLIFAAFSASTASAQNRPWTLVCFEQQGLQDVLSKVVNMQQFLQNSLGQTASINYIRGKGCDYAQIPSGSTARSAGFYQSDRFIFPLFRVTYATTGQRMYVADAIFPLQNWRATQQCGLGGYAVAGQMCIVPVDCLVLDGFYNFRRSRGQGMPDYVVSPRGCQQYVIE